MQVMSLALMLLPLPPKVRLSFCYSTLSTGHRTMQELCESHQALKRLLLALRTWWQGNGIYAVFSPYIHRTTKPPAPRTCTLGGAACPRHVAIRAILSIGDPAQRPSMWLQKA